MAAKQETKPRTCTCANAFQDREYGRGMRLANQTKKGWRCTSCGTESMGGGFEGSLVTASKSKK